MAGCMPPIKFNILRKEGEGVELIFDLTLFFLLPVTLVVIITIFWLQELSILSKIHIAPLIPQFYTNLMIITVREKYSKPPCGLL